MGRRLFLAHSFASENLDSNGNRDESMMSDIQMANFVSQWIREFNPDIEVVRTSDPFHGYIPTNISRDMARCDFVLCMFSGRTRDGLTGKWLPSTYVVSEAALAFGIMPNEEERLRRLHCLVEDRVDRSQLGLAFHSAQTQHEFRRNDKEGLKQKVRELVDYMAIGNVPPRPEKEYLSIHKRVWIWRNGSVLVETRHKFRFKEAQQFVRIPHTIWRISDRLPELESLLKRGETNVAGFLTCTLIDLGHAGQRAGTCKIVPGNTSPDSHEHSFFVEISNVNVNAGEEISYAIAWGYMNAFNNLASELYPNSVGIRTGGRGMAKSASLTLMFERDTEEHNRIIEKSPQLWRNGDTAISVAESPAKYWHDSSRWELQGSLNRCMDSSGAVYEAYHWQADSFVGTAKVTWNAHFNYFQPNSGIASRLAIPSTLSEFALVKAC